jgi:hypothetical protein
MRKKGGKRQNMKIFNNKGEGKRDNIERRKWEKKHT